MLNLQSEYSPVRELDDSHPFVLPQHLARPPLKYEQLVLWAQHEWAARYPDVPYRVVWSDPNCAHHSALTRIRPGRRLKGKARYSGYQVIPCPYSVPVQSFYVPARTVALTSNVGAYVFTFERAGQSFDVLFVSAHHTESCGHGSVAVALVPAEQLLPWGDFEVQCDQAAHRLERSDKVHIIGGAQQSFQPNVGWDSVILPDELKADLRADIETFFDSGVSVYAQLNLPAFRKLLLVGPPGTGKSTLCAAIAKLALVRKCIVVYVSASDKDEASFSKIQRALRIAANSQHPVLLVVEELDIYLKPESKSQILNVLDGFESPNNPNGTLLIATTNYPEIIDERIAKRPGRVDRIIYIPEIQEEEQALRMLKHYMAMHWHDEYSVVANKLIGQTGAFVREVAIYARMLALRCGKQAVSLELLEQSIIGLSNQLSTGRNLLPRKQVGFVPSNEPAHMAHLNRR
jgi:hypothetical protein